MYCSIKFDYTLIHCNVMIWERADSETKIDNFQSYLIFFVFLQILLD